MSWRTAMAVLLMGAAWSAWGADESVTLRLRGAAEQYGRQEIAFQIPERVANAYDADDVAVSGVFRAPSGKVLRIPAFYYEEADAIRNSLGKRKEWRLRFCPDEVGEYGVSVVFSRRRRQAKEIAQGSFGCVASKRTGFVKRAGRGFVVGMGGAFVPLGANRCWGNVLHTDEYLTDMERQAESGANVIRVWLAPWWMPVEPVRGRYDAIACARMDAILAKAEELGLRVILCIEQHGNLEPAGREVGRWPEHPYNANNGGPCRDIMHFFTSYEARRLFGNRLRYLVARYGHSTAIMAWEFFNEVEWIPVEYGGFAQNRPLLEEWHRVMGAYLRQLDAFGHLVATSGDAQMQVNLVKAGAVDFVQLHVYGDSLADDIANAVGDMRNRVDVPVVVSEFGWRTRKDGVGYVTEGVCSAFMSGASGALPWLQDDKNLEDGYARMKSAAEFINAISPLAGFEPIPTQNLVSARKLEGGGWAVGQDCGLKFMGLRRKDEVVLFIRRAAATPALKGTSGVLLIGLPSSAYAVEYWDPSLGEKTGEAHVTAAGETLVVEMPEFKGQLAVRVKAAQASTP